MKPSPTFPRLRSRRQARRPAIPCALLFALLALAGCSTTAETVALTAAGVSAGLFGANLLATESKLDVTVEHFDSRDLDQELFKQDQAAILARAGQAQDVVADPTPEAIAKVITQIDPPLQSLTRRTQALKITIESLKALDLDHEVMETKVAAVMAPVIDELQQLAGSSERLIQLVKEFKALYQDSQSDGLTSGELALLAEKIRAIRTAAAAADGHKLSSAYIEYLQDQLRSSTLKMLTVVAEQSRPGLLSAFNALPAAYPPDDKSQSNEARIAATVAVFVRTVFPHVPRESRPEAFKILSETLVGVGIDAPPQTTSTFFVGDAAANPDVIAAAFQLPPITELAALKRKTTIKTSGDLYDTALESRAVVAEAKEAVFQATFVRFGIDFNLGPIRSELLQSLLTSQAINLITDPANKSRWHHFSHARSHGQTGNHNVVVYMETLGLPVLKSSAFDPTKFQVASGLLFRKAFNAVVDVVGMPTAKSAAPAGAATPVGSVNLNEAKTARLEAEASTKERQAAAVSALKTVLNGAVAANAEPEPTITDQAKRDAVRDAAKKALQDAAKALRAEAAPTAKSGQPSK